MPSWFTRPRTVTHKVLTRQWTTGSRTRDLLITSPTPYSVSVAVRKNLSFNFNFLFNERQRSCSIVYVFIKSTHLEVARWCSG